MAIKNYRTELAAIKTVGQIQEILATMGVNSSEIEYFDRKPDAIKFKISIFKKEFNFRLPCNPHGVLNTMKRDGVAKTYLTLEHARNVSWRIIKDWLHAQLAIIDAGQAQTAEVFLPYLLEADGSTLYRKFEEQQRLLGE